MYLVPLCDAGDKGPTETPTPKQNRKGKSILMILVT